MGRARALLSPRWARQLVPTPPCRDVGATRHGRASQLDSESERRRKRTQASIAKVQTPPHVYAQRDRECERLAESNVRRRCAVKVAGEQQGSKGRRERDGAGDGDREQESPERDDARRRMANAGCAHDVGRQSQELSCRVHEQKEDNERANDARRQELRRRRCKEGVRLWPCPEDERGRRAPTCRPDAFWGPAARARTIDFPGPPARSRAC